MKKGDLFEQGAIFCIAKISGNGFLPNRAVQTWYNKTMISVLCSDGPKSHELDRAL
jgi:hypothetical protein